MSIRFQLLLVALTTLVLPWAGCQYARELETALRASQEQALLASAGTIANTLSAQPQRVFRDQNDSAFDAARGDIYVFPLSRQPLLDGYRADWDVHQDPVPLPGRQGPAARWQVGITDRYLYLYLEVDDAHFNPEPVDLHPGRDRFDHVDVLIERPDGALQPYFFATTAEGLIAAQSIVKGEDGLDRATPEPRIQGYWLQKTRVYHLEARIPLSLIGTHLWVEAKDDAPVAPAAADALVPPPGGRLFFAPAGLSDLLGTFIRAGTRATVIDRSGFKLGAAGALAGAGERASHDLERTWLARFLELDTSLLPPRSTAADRLEGAEVARALEGKPQAVWLRADGEPLLSAASPILIDSQVRGAVVLEEGGADLVGSRDRALAHLFNLTVLATAVAVIFVLGFATWISVRIGRLGLAADSALATDGSIRRDMPESRRGDEIGALARSFERLLMRLAEHTQYLRTLGGKLSHELRTPLTIVRSSLDNLESEGLTREQRTYVTRAREGSLRLSNILSALGAAARVEESIKQAERVNFDLRELLISAVAAYRDGFSQVRFDLATPAEPCFLRGAPDLIVQMLDKLVENAVDFCPREGRIDVRLTRAESHYEIEVGNDGPPIPEAMLGRLFESLSEQRAGQDDKPHFGLGLYIVRLIAEFHGGKATAANRADGAGAVFTVTLPIS